MDRQNFSRKQLGTTVFSIKVKRIQDPCWKCLTIDQRQGYLCLARFLYMMLLDIKGCDLNGGLP